MRIKINLLDKTQFAVHFEIETLPNGYETEVGENGIKLSGGQKQLISLSRVLLKNPPIIILDEAMSFLDKENTYQVTKTIQAIMKDRTTIIISHDPLLIKFSDKIIVLKNGHIIENGSFKELINKKGYFSKLYYSKFN